MCLGLLREQFSSHIIDLLHRCSNLRGQDRVASPDEDVMYFYCNVISVRADARSLPAFPIQGRQKRRVPHLLPNLRKELSRYLLAVTPKTDALEHDCSILEELHTCYDWPVATMNVL